MNLCRTCDCNFASVESFDAHRVGTHDYTYSEGAAMNPPREDGRRCLSIDEMLDTGWDLDVKGEFHAPAMSDLARVEL